MASKEQLVREFILQEFMQDKSPSLLTDDTRLVDEEIIDSLGIFQLVNFLQERFGIEIGPEDVTLENFETTKAMISLVESRLVESPDHG
jgi:acyl carrier protein